MGSGRLQESPLEKQASSPIVISVALRLKQSWVCFLDISPAI